MIEDSRIVLALDWNCHIPFLFKNLRDRGILSSDLDRKIHLDRMPAHGANYIVAPSLDIIMCYMGIKKNEKPLKVFRKYLVNLNLGQKSFMKIDAGEEIYNMLESYGFGDRFLGVNITPGLLNQAKSKNIPCSSLTNLENIVNFLKK